MKIKHKISPDFAEQFQEVVTRIRAYEAEVERLEGQLRKREQEISFMRRHLGALISIMEKVDKLPPSKTPYVLSDDGLTVTGEKDEKHLEMVRGQ